MAREPQTSDPSGALDERFVRRVLFVVAVVGAIALTFKLATVLLMLFASLLIAVVIRALAALLKRYAQFPPPLALATAFVIFFGLIVTGLAVLVFEISGQLERLPETLPQAWAAAEPRIRPCRSGRRLWSGYVKGRRAPGCRAMWGRRPRTWPRPCATSCWAPAEP